MNPQDRRAPALLRPALATLAVLALLWTAMRAQAAGQWVLALGLLVFGGTAVAVYATQRSLAWKYLFPGVAGMLVFMAVPLLYTVQLSFTNYSSAHLLTEARARDYLLAQVHVDEASLRPFTLHHGSGGWVLALGGRAAAADEPLRTPSLGPGGALPLPVPLGSGAPPGAARPLREVIAQRDWLQQLPLQLPDGTLLRYAGLREFGVVNPVWLPAEGGALRQRESGRLFRPSADSGFFEDDGGERLTPGFRTGIGWAHYARMLLDTDFRSPFVSIFAWTVGFAALTVVFTTAIGLTLAVLLEWPALRFRALYRTLLFLPYAVPGFISILVFKGLFNQNFGEINAILDALLGLRPAWFADPLLAKVMLLVVNTWLGYPYVMVLATGLIKAIPADLYEASAIAGAGPLANFLRITAPLIMRPLAPLLVASFAFNFNNFVLIALLTDGRPDFLDTKLPAGTNDILVSYTYRIAFTDAGQNFGLAAAVSTLIFILVAVMGVVQLRLSHARAGR